jgi:hypothetical protein
MIHNPSLARIQPPGFEPSSIIFLHFKRKSKGHRCQSGLK